MLQLDGGGKGAAVMEWLTRWWRQPSHYDWFTGYLHAHGMCGAIRAVMAFTSAAMALCLLALLSSADGPHGAVSVSMMWVAFTGGIAGALLWTWRWPTHAQSVAYGTVSNVSIALACLAHPNPLAALIGCIAFGVLGGYLALFHTSRYVLYNFAVAAGVGVVESARLLASGHPALAGVDLWLVLQINVALPVAIQILIRVLGADLMLADRDVLTGLLNRRGFHRETLELLLRRDGRANVLVVAVIDLDCFKAVNDAHGHAAGDQVLAQVAEALRASARASAVIARRGGEEFVIVDTAADSDAGPVLAQRICAAIADLPAQVTASVGTTSAPLHGAEKRRYHSLVEGLVHVADTAMYTAKRNGGNRIHHHRIDGR